MVQPRKIATAAGTFAVALGIGFVMQNGDALASRISADRMDMPVGEGLTLPPAPAAASVIPVQLPSLRTPAPIDLSQTSTAVLRADPVATPDMPTMPTQVIAVNENAEIVPADSSVLAEPALTQSCEPSLSGIASPAAMVDLTLDAPCAPSALVTIHHQGLMFSVLTDADGRAEISAPALASTSIFIAEIVGQEAAMSIVPVPDFADYDRAVVQWQGDAGLELHALEFGATYGEPGHVWAAAARDADAAEAGEGGFLVRLGEPSLPESYLAEVYTYPSGDMPATGSVLLTVEAEVTASNCGQRVQAQTIQVRPGSNVAVLDLEMTLPGCDATGEFLVLNNLLTDLTLASR